MEILPTLVEHYGEPYADSSAVPTYYVSRETRRYVTVALNGDGGDESFAGYERHAAMLIAERYKKLPAALRKVLIEGPIGLVPTSETKKSRTRDLKRFLAAAGLPRTERYFRWMSAFEADAKRSLFTDDFIDELNGRRASAPTDDWFERADGIGQLDALLLNDLMNYLPNDLLVKVDIASMANSLEARSPFLDHNVIEFAASLPENLKLKGLETKSILKKIASRLVPREVIYRRKMGFGVPIGKWLGGEMKGFLKEILLSERSMNRGVVRPEQISKLITEHIKQKQDHAFRLWTLLMFELWCLRFIDRP
jgi:asparagine synthase (glutamine-hydrolysing)